MNCYAIQQFLCLLLDLHHHWLDLCLSVRYDMVDACEKLQGLQSEGLASRAIQHWDLAEVTTLCHASLSSPVVVSCGCLLWLSPVVISCRLL